MNRFNATGRLTKDPELRALPSGKSVCEMRVAVDGMGRGSTAGYINLSVYGPSGEAAARVLSKGRRVAIDGRLEWHEWNTENGNRHEYGVVGYVEFLDRPHEHEEEPAAAAA